MGRGEETGPCNGDREAFGGTAVCPGPGGTAGGGQAGRPKKHYPVSMKGVRTSTVVRGK